MKKYLYSMLIMALFAIGFAASDDSNPRQDDSSSSSVNDNLDVDNDEFLKESNETQYVNESNDIEDPLDEKYAWLQGHWVYDLPYGTRIHVVIEGNRIIQYSNSRSESTNPTFFGRGCQSPKGFRPCRTGKCRGFQTVDQKGKIAL